MRRSRSGCDDAGRMPPAAAAAEFEGILGCQELCRVGLGTLASRGASSEDDDARVGATARRSLAALATEKSRCVSAVDFDLATILAFICL